MSSQQPLSDNQPPATHAYSDGAPDHYDETPRLNRRNALAAALGTATCAALAAETLAANQNAKQSDKAEPRKPLAIRKAVKFHMIQGNASLRDKFKMLKDIGYDGVEIRTRDKVDRAAALRASEAVELPIHGVINSSDPDIISAVKLSKYFGGTSVLVVAGRVNKTQRYDQVYRETQDIIRRALKTAEKANIRILVENVWNGLLLSPLEMARYLDELESPVVGAYFDVGNVVRFGWPQHWIPILGKRIVKLDIKEYSRKIQLNEGLRKGFKVPIGEGDCDWPEVRAELRKLDFQGWATAEVPGGDRDRLADIAARMDKVLELA